VVSDQWSVGAAGDELERPERAGWK